MLNDPGKNLLNLGPVIEEVKTLLQSHQETKVKWVRRTANVAAHLLAKEGVSHELCKVWFHVPPDFILSVVSAEILNSFD